MVKHAISTRNKQGFSYELTSFGKAFVNFASKSSKPVMDIGAAYGVATLPALLAGAKVIAVDIEDKHLRALQESVDTQLRGRLQTLQQRFPHFDVPSESLDAVYMSQVLPFLTGEEIEAGARKIYDWLAPGGEVFVVSFTPYISHVKSFVPFYETRKANGVRWSGYIHDLSRFSDDPNIFSQLPNQIHHIDADDLRYAYENAGFVIKEIRYFGEEEGPLPEGIRMDGRERVGMIACKPTGSTYWKTITATNTDGVPDAVRDWLCKPFVLSNALRKVCNDFTVEIADQCMKPWYADEIAALKCYETPMGYIRETYLGDTGNPLVYARVTMPERTYAANKENLDNLGNRPIGETILYKDPATSRTQFEVKRITQDDELLFNTFVHRNFYRAEIGKVSRDTELWARRSVFNIGGNPMLITEVFMPDIPKYID